MARHENVLLNTECETEWNVESYASIATVRMSSAHIQINSFTLVVGPMRFGDVSGAGQNATATSRIHFSLRVGRLWQGSVANDESHTIIMQR